MWQPARYGCCLQLATSESLVSVGWFEKATAAVTAAPEIKIHVIHSGVERRDIGQGRLVNIVFRVHKILATSL